MLDDQLPPCPFSPNCVSSDTDPRDRRHYIEPFRLDAPPERAWDVLCEILENTPRVTIVEHTDTVLRAEFKIAVFGFVDDAEFHLRAADSIIAVRSASRLGNWDWGVNRRRVERLRSTLRKAGVVASRDA